MKLRILLILIIGVLGLAYTIPAQAADVTVIAKPPSVLPTVTASNATDVSGTAATLNCNITDAGGESVTTRGFEWGFSSSNYTISWNETGTFDADTFSHEVNNLTICTEVFWIAFAVNTVGRTNSTEQSFSTSCLPGPPTDFTATVIGNTIVSLSWVMDSAADTVIIRGSTDDYPSSVTDGYLVYSGNETSVVIDGLNMDTSSYFYSAWSQNDYGYSEDYAEANAGHPIGLANIIFVLGLLGFSLWKKQWIRVLFSICILMWGAFAIQYDVKIAAPLIAAAAILLISGIFELMRQREVRYDV
jgi:hypothetical protein